MYTVYTVRMYSSGPFVH